MNVAKQKHYNQYSIELIDMMIRIWGVEKTITFCEMNAYKHRMRVGHKGAVAEDLAKEAWYLNKAEELRTGDNPIYSYA